MKTIMCGLTAVVLLCVAQNASANSLAHCLQKGLLDAGHDPKGVDGDPGNGTFKAAATYLVANAGVGLPELSRSTRRDLDVLTAWCAHFDPPLVLYGNGFQTIKNQSTGVTNIGYHGALVMRSSSTPSISAPAAWRAEAWSITPICHSAVSPTGNAPM